ncbi:MAG: hypothetical protein NXI09_12860 [Bacteroidetes bacterium]|nr:hypothetical protein [Bacteroidota bacterium]
MTQFRFFLFLLLFSASLYAQDYSYRRYWSEEDLKLADFQGAAIPGSPFVSELSFNLQSEYKTLKKEGIYVSAYTVQVYANRESSWIKPSLKDTATTLLYNSTILNIVEFHARRLEIRLNKLQGSNIEINNLAQEYYQETVDQYQLELHDLAVETQQGLIDSSVQSWYQNSKIALDTTPRLNLRKTEDLDFAWSMDIGIGYSFNDGSMDQYLNNRFDYLLYGVMIQHKKLHFESRIALGLQKSVLAYADEDYSFGSDTSNSSSSGTLTVGYQIYKNERLLIYPFLGFGVLNYSRRNPNDAHSRLEGPTSFHPALGLNFDYILRTNSISQRNRNDLFIKSRILYEPVNYRGPINGNTISISLSIGFKSQSTRILDTSKL